VSNERRIHKIAIQEKHVVHPIMCERHRRNDIIDDINQKEI